MALYVFQTEFEHVNMVIAVRRVVFTLFLFLLLGGERYVEMGK